mmetsp:Transcript_5145/g.7929  ORF Transcript_5145/g.7929 Transcript_5145/m.7929 type:complete len:230 (-) Transcript_5145:463-1152(-)
MPQPRGNSVEIHCFVKKSTDAHLMVLLTKGLQSWRKNEELNTDNFPEWYHQLISEQNAIGWRQLFNGRWSTQWSVIQHQHYQQKKTKNQTGHKWSKQMLLVICYLWGDLWKCRNSTEHGDLITDQHAITQGRLLQELKDLYADRPNYVPNQKVLLIHFILARLSQTDIKKQPDTSRPQFHHQHEIITCLLLDQTSYSWPATTAETPLHSHSSHPTPPLVPLSTTKPPTR